MLRRAMADTKLEETVALHSPGTVCQLSINGGHISVVNRFDPQSLRCHIREGKEISHRS